METLNFTTVAGLTPEQLKAVQKISDEGIAKAVQETKTEAEATFKIERDTLSKTVRQTTEARVQKQTVDKEQYQQVLNKLQKYEEKDFNDHIAKHMKDFNIKEDFESDVRDKVLQNIKFEDDMSIEDKTSLFLKETKKFCKEDANQKYIQQTGIPPLKPNVPSPDGVKNTAATENTKKEDAEKAYNEAFGITGD